jgi:hypothetical protein
VRRVDADVLQFLAVYAEALGVHLELVEAGGLEGGKRLQHRTHHGWQLACSSEGGSQRCFTLVCSIFFFSCSLSLNVTF